jgi:Novel STAND NTPase 1/TIR domain/Protein of unknown function (DUF1566)
MVSTSPKLAAPLIFLSHAGQDTTAAKELADQLGQAGLSVWLDVERLKLGDRWMEEIEEGLRHATALVVYVGQSGVQGWVDAEVRVALDRSTKDLNFRLIPVLGPGSNPETLPLFLRQYQWLDLREGFTRAGQLKDLLGVLSGKPSAQVSLLPPGGAPFRGLSSFDVDDALLFYGRDRETGELLERLRKDSFLSVVGNSGSGKSSLVQAGLIPALHRGRFHDGKSWVGSWRIAILRPGDDPFRELAEALPDLKPETSPDSRADFIDGTKKQLSQGVEGLRSRIAGLVPRGSHTLLVIDQFEELFTLTEEIENRRRFIDSLFKAAQSGGERPVHVLITLRADFYSHCWQHPELLKRTAANQYNVGRLSPEGLRQVIEKPLALAGATAELGLVEGILNDLGDEPGNLPLLEDVLLQLWERRDAQVLTHEAYNQIGRLSGALKNHADQVYDHLANSQHQDFARKIFLRLTQLGEGSQDTRRRMKRADLLRLCGNEETAAEVLKTLTDARLITSSGKVPSEKDRGEELVEVAHEALIREWPRLKSWVNESRDALRIERQTLQAAEEWDVSERDPGLLLGGTKLAAASEWAKEHEQDLPERTRQFLTDSRRQAEDERKKKRRLMELAALMAVFAIGTLSWLFYDQRQRAQRLLAESTYIDSEAELMWTRTDNLQEVNWNDAKEYCENLTLGEYSDWRMPSIDELIRLYDPKQQDAVKIKERFRLTGYWVWSSTRQGHEALVFSPNNGLRSSVDLDIPYNKRAICVRPID